MDAEEFCSVPNFNSAYSPSDAVGTNILAGTTVVGISKNCCQFTSPFILGKPIPMVSNIFFLASETSSLAFLTLILFCKTNSCASITDKCCRAEEVNAKTIAISNKFIFIDFLF